MAAAAQTTPARPSQVAWFRDFLREELAPYPGRGVIVARILCAAAIVMILTMTFQIPFGWVATLFTLLITRESPEATVKAARVVMVAFAAGGVDVLVGAMFFSGEPLLRLAWVILSLFLAFFLLGAMANYAAALQFGTLICISIPIWDQHISAEQKVETTLWAIGAILMATFTATVVELIYAGLQPYQAITVSLTRRLTATSALLHSWSEGIQDKEAEQHAMRMSILGTSRMRKDLQRTGYAPEYAQRMGAIVALVGRLVDLAAAVPQFAGYEVAFPESSERERLLRLIDRVEAIVDRLRDRAAPMPALAAEGAGAAGTIPLLAEMEGTTDLIVEMFGAAEAPNYLALAPIEEENAQPRFFLPDAFLNPRHLRFAIRGALAAIACYIFYNVVDWPGLSTSVVTCFLTALTTIGASRQKQALRFSGAIVGGFIFGFGAQIFVLPGIDSITGFLLLLTAVTLFAAWFAVAGPRLSYFGVQVAAAFFLINLNEFRFQTSLSVARNRVIGVLLGLAMMWLIFDQFWSASAVVTMRQTFVSGLRMLARLMREPLSPDPRLVVDQTLMLRDTINTTFENLRQQADGVSLEFGPSRERDLAVRAQLLGWSLQLRIFFLARNTLLKYRMHLPGFELPPDKQQAQKNFDNGMAVVLDAMADRLDGKPQQPGELDPHELFEQLEKAMRRPSAGEAPSEAARYQQTFVPLTQRIVGILATLREEVESSSVTAAGTAQPSQAA
jgi:multidrug resistance protein MdtO